MKKQDLREHNTGELSLLVFNDEYLYKMRRNQKLLLETLNDLYIYSSEQLSELESDLADDAKEEE